MVFRISLFFCGLTAVWGVFFPRRLAAGAQAFTGFFLTHLDWFFLLCCAFFILVSFFLAVSWRGDLRLGGPGERPEFKTLSWLSMLFAAGMGSGLLFWGVTEPMTHFMQPPPGAPSLDFDKARWAMVITNLHWGFHAWAIYAIGALALAYFGFRKGTPLLASGPIRQIFTGQQSRKWAGAADVVAVLSVIFGVVGSLGMGTLQINSGLSQILGTVDGSTGVSLAILAGLTICYMLSASTGLGKGIRWLSNINMVLAVTLLTAVLFLGPTHFLFSVFTTSIGDYLGNLVTLSTKVYPFRDKMEWSHGWTITYLIWWIAWAPFVGIFIARISRGRTIREFVTGVILLPSLFSMLWFAVMGGSGLHVELFEGGGLGAIALSQPQNTLFAFLQRLPWSELWQLTALALVFIFLVTSADSACFVLGMMTSRGSLNPGIFRKLIWGAVMTLMAAAILFSRGGPEALKSLAIVGAIPFVIVMLVHIYCLLRDMQRERELRR